LLLYFLKDSKRDKNKKITKNNRKFVKK